MSIHNKTNDSSGGVDANNYVDYGSSSAAGGDLESESFGPGPDDGGSLTTAQMLNDPHGYYYSNHHHSHHGSSNSQLYEYLQQNSSSSYYHSSNPAGRPSRREDNDATSVVHEMHLALLYLLSNPEEFQRALASRGPVRGGATTLHEWNAEYEDAESMAENDTIATDFTGEGLPHHSQNSRTTSTGTTTNTTPLPFVVFADDAEVVLPAAHTASQLFGVEKVTGMELEAAAGVPALSQLFLRWLALMPGGDHLNLIDPPGLTVMRIAGGRYRVTAAHRVVWMWMNEFPNLWNHHPAQYWNDESGGHSAAAMDPFSPEYDHGDILEDETTLSSLDATANNHSHSQKSSSSNSPRYHHHRHSSVMEDEEGMLRPGDLVTLTIVDVFETDNQGKLLSYCPTFDNRRVLKTNATTENLRKSTAHLAKIIGKVQKSTLAKKISYHATKIAVALREKVEEAVVHHNNNHNSKSSNRFSPRGKLTAGAGGSLLPSLPSSLSSSPTRLSKKKNNTTTWEEKKDSVSSSSSSNNINNKTKGAAHTTEV